MAVRGFATREVILKIRDLNRVLFIEHHEVHAAFHDQALAMVSQDRVRSIYPGTNVPAGVIDTGIDSTPWHQDFGGKGFLGWQTTTENVYQDGNGHGTHVTGTITGRGVSDKRYTGCAPQIARGGEGDRMFIGRYLRDSGFSQGNVATLYTNFKNGSTYAGKFNPKRAVVSCSWGSSTSSGYYGTEAAARSIDGYVHSYQQTYCFSSGNKGTTANLFTGNPGSAKNVLTVGSLTDTFTSSSQPGLLSSFSRYNTRDNRRKPEVSAVGQILTSCNINTSTGYANKSGTSMSCPTVAGCVASVIDRSTFWQYNPAAVKALASVSAKAGTSIGFNSKQGFGMINSHKMNFASSKSSWSARSGSLTWPTTTSASWTVAVPSTAVAVKVVLCYTESPGSGGATSPIVNKLKLWGDVPPYTSGASGEWSMSNGGENVIWGAPTTTFKGKSVRFTVQATSLALSHRVNYGVVLLWYYKTPTSSTTTLTNSVSPTRVKPSQSVILTSTLGALSTQDEFSAAQIYFSGSSSWTNTKIERTTIDNILMSYTGTGHKSSPYPRPGVGSTTGMAVGQGSSRRAKFTLKAPTSSGNYTLYTRARRAGSTASVLSNAMTVCVDGLAPNAIASLTANRSINTWYNSTSINHSWTKATDNGCAGVYLLRYVPSTTGLKVPSTSSASLGATTTSRSNTFVNGKLNYFSIRVYDRLLNSSSYKYRGPYWIDTTKPLMWTVSVANGATYTTLSTVAVLATATDTFSGAYQMRYSGNGSSWTGWYSYTTANRTIALGSYGWTGPGTRCGYVQVRDRAGNISSSKTDCITYDNTKPVVTTVVVNNGAAYTSSTTVAVRATATDTYSGAYQMRYSGNGSNWTGWYSYTTANRTIALGGLGWTSQGSRCCYVQVRDRAGNISASKADCIIYLLPPAILGATISTLPNLTRGYYRLTGNNFAGVTRAYFGTTLITAKWTSTNDDWWNTGAFRIVSDTELRVYPPQGKAPGTYGIRCRNAAWTSNTRNVSLTFQSGRILYANSLLTAGKPLSIIMARSSSEPSTTPGLIVLSPFNTPSVWPGYLTLEIGAGFSAYNIVITTAFSSSTRVIHLTFPTLPAYKGASVYWEGVYMRNAPPLPTTNAWKTTLN